MNKALDLLHGLVREVERKTCGHEETHRGGAIWEICDSCGAKWADDEGGKPEFAWPESVEKARAFLATHHAVEQAGGDERAEFERAFTVQEGIYFDDKRGEYRSMNLCAIEASDAQDLNLQLQGWQARAALAQPSPAQAEQHWPKLEKPAQVGAIRFRAGLSSRLVVEAAQRLYEFESTPEKEAERIERLQAFREQCFEQLGAEFSKVLSENLVELSSEAKPEQAEAERPEVAEVAFVLRNIGAMDAEDIDGDNVDLRFEDAEGRDTGCDVSIVEYAEKAADLLEQQDRIVGELRADRDSWAEQAEQRLADWDEMRKERDAALARVAELERQEPVDVPGPDEIHQMAFEEGQPAEDGDGYLFSAEEFDLFVQRLLDSCATPVARAQHSVPAAWYYDAPSQAEAAIIDIRGMWGEDDCPTYEDVASALRRLLSAAPGCHLSRNALTEAQMRRLYENSTETENERLGFAAFARLMRRAEAVHQIAAAPGKEVPQAWLDVQAERRRQVEVEGYHGFRDNHYISYELSKAARAYIEVSWHALSGGLPCKKPESWPWVAGFKWSDGRTMLVKACALVLAEIERLDRAAHGKEVGHE
ncbi:TPA: hypothetical protein VDU70_002225 [Pseudomonas aeruginosa]|nr:hypothetical protein [Pseudomonas aeruginosa]HEP8852274.1 hypothetical protein [Pseudomonas aeruginosa]